MKSYNPFKMWGSYAGLYLFAVFIPFGIWEYFNKTAVLSFNGIMNFTFINHLQNGYFFSYPFSNQLLFYGLIILTIGFLIGWGINSLWRKFRK